jgi:hypothetical protein
MAVSVVEIFRTSVPERLEAVRRRREFLSPDDRWMLRLNYVGEARMGMDIYDAALFENGRDVSSKHHAIRGLREKGGVCYVPTAQPWSANSRAVFIAIWGTPLHPERSYIYDVDDKALRPCPAPADRVEASSRRPVFLLSWKNEAAVVTTAGETCARVAIAIPGDIPYWQWLPSGDAFLHFPALSASSEAALTIFDSGGQPIYQIKIDSTQVVPFEPDTKPVRQGGRFALNYGARHTTGRYTACWRTAFFDDVDSVLYLMTLRPTGRPFTVTPEVSPARSDAFTTQTFLAGVSSLLSKLSGQQSAKFPPLVPHLACRPKEEWVGVRLRDV